uniref:Uncharacterized protein n=1 Tax=Timema bartmani TaxID=61472 RepID=A0A7R9EZ95_9NEOP|nr:unnamed protein product [Timema bartmani]
MATGGRVNVGWMGAIQGPAVASFVVAAAGVVLNRDMMSRNLFSMVVMDSWSDCICSAIPSRAVMIFCEEVSLIFTQWRHVVL